MSLTSWDSKGKVLHAHTNLARRHTVRHRVMKRQQMLWLLSIRCGVRAIVVSEQEGGLAMVAACVPITPFGLPVEPDV